MAAAMSAAPSQDEPAETCASRDLAQLGVQAISSPESSKAASEKTPLLFDKQVDVASVASDACPLTWLGGLSFDCRGDVSSTRREHVEALRFICCCMVLCYHYGSPGIGFQSITALRYLLARHAYASYTPLVGVLNSSYPSAIFFTISGYVLASKFVKRRDFKELHYLCHKRLLRILPCCICIVALYEFQVRAGLLSVLARGKFYTRTSWVEAQDGYLPGMRECGVLGPVCHGLGVSTPFWAICFELIAPHFLLLMAHMSPPPNCGLVGQRWFAAFAFIGLPLLTPFTYPLSGFAAGYFLAEQDFVWSSVGGKEQKSQRGIIVAVTLAFHFLAGSIVDPFNCIHLHWCGIAYQLSGSALVWLICASPRAQLLLQRSGLQRLGHLAFPLFVVHLLAIKDVGFVREVWPLAAPFIACAEVVLLALLLHRYVEAPCAAIADIYATWMTATPKIKAGVGTSADRESVVQTPQASKRDMEV